jgi:Tfp pilus assembly protein PilO
MPSPLTGKLLGYRFALGAALGSAGLFLLALLFLVGNKPQKIKQRHRDIEALQERLISAQITSRGLSEVRGLIERNLAYSAQDTLAQGASLAFLYDLHKVLDNLGVAVLGIEPQAPEPKGRFIETPYVLEVECTFRQLTDLVDKMEKSPRFITLSAIELNNRLEDYFGERGSDHTPGAFRVKMTLSTLTLVKES